MFHKYNTGIILFFALFISCAFITTDIEKSEEELHPGMRKILSAGKSFQQGWNDARASFDEKPGMLTSFTYDYWLDITEITQKQFYDLTGRKPVSEGSQFGVGDNYPVYNVTWFDAVLFCNARSRAENLDTVYVYFGKKADPNGSVYELTGLRCNFLSNGYRLPTEAEWEFAARGASSNLPFSNPADSITAQQYAWFYLNAGDRSHPVASLVPDRLGLYDMAGNVFEWTNDWKYFYYGAQIKNPLGGPLPNSQFERVMKGGSFRHGYQFLRSSVRSSTYPTTVSSMAEYIGFRCARGDFTQGTYCTQQSDTVTTNPLDLLAGDAAFVFKSMAAKLVFVNVTGPLRTLCYVDFASSHPCIQEVRTDEEVYCPAISPDGRYVAYSTKGEGLGGPSKIRVRVLDSLSSDAVSLPCDSGFVPRWWIDPATNDTVILYTNSAVPNNSAAWSFSKTYVQSMRKGKPYQDPRVIIDNGSYHDGRSSNGRFIVTGYTQLLLYDFLSGQAKQLFTWPHNGKDAGGSNQVCNVSTGPDSGTCGRSLFLDFGYPGVSTVTNTSYGTHEVLFIADSNDSIVQWIDRPEGESAWDYPEWSNSNRFAVSCARNMSGNATAVYSIDLWQKSYRKLVAGMELEHPCLWIGGVSGLTPYEIDSLGAYNDPPLHATQARFATRMHFFWQLCGSIEYLFVGSSHASFSIEPHAFKQRRVYNMAYGHCDQRAIINIIRNYVLNHCKSIKFIGIDFIPGLLYLSNGDLTFSLGLSASKGYKYDSLRSFWKAGLKESIKSGLINRPYSIIGNMDSLNLERSPSAGWGGENPSNYIEVEWDTTNLNYKKNMVLWENLIADLTRLGVQVLFFVSPENPVFVRKQGIAGRNGPSLETGKQVLARVKKLESRFQRFHLYDAYQFGEHDYTDAEASDPDHLSSNGAWKFSRRLDSLISTFMPH